MEKFNASHAAWYAELVRVYGSDAEHFCYSSRGHGESGSELHQLWIARKVAHAELMESRQ